MVDIDLLYSSLGRSEYTFSYRGQVSIVDVLTRPISFYDCNEIFCSLQLVTSCLDAFRFSFLAGELLLNPVDNIF